MTTKPTAKKFRIRKPILPGDGGVAQDVVQAAATDTGRAEGAAPGGAQDAYGRDADMAALQLPVDTVPVDTVPVDAMPDAGADAMPPLSADIDAIRREGLTGRQLRMARRVAQKNGMAVTSDFDAVRQLRLNGIDPFQRSTVLELVTPETAGPDAGRMGGGTRAPGAALGALPGIPAGRVQLPQTTPDGSGMLPSPHVIPPSERHLSEIAKIQRDLGRRRRRRTFNMLARIAIFVLLPTIAVGYYYYSIATPMYATSSEFVIQQAEPASGGAGGLGGLFQGTSMATQQDSIAVQSYLASRAAMARLDADHGFKAVFADPSIDPVQRLPADATNEAAFSVYQDRVKLSYDPTEGMLKMDVIAPSPEASETFSQALIGYAEEQVDQLTQRLREDQMSGARESYESAETKRSDALAAWLTLQQNVQQIDPIGETAAMTQQISALETQRQSLTLSLQDRLNVTRPNEAQVNALRTQIANIETLIADMRQQMTDSTATGTSLAARNTDLRLAEENYTFQTLLAQQALTQMETARIEANRQVRYLSLSVEPVAPDEATYPKAFENTILAFLIFSGIYLMISITASVLREQVTN
ncbi:capsular polysaccharide transport system permease protein [Loktanella fryxellensis]|uniref:Capsular polysaccharide transport system permease protein n=1 Tax=Loktanella fryxellensis TaxID=245187 RepID=A0A1H8B2A3_9RHOB|nr:capsule biosynthesis protein [Loktanella fryxellensis]SEM76883.1 capsular polysaccharide transport system permease protein [Loktanella fryxellensis]